MVKCKDCKFVVKNSRCISDYYADFYCNHDKLQDNSKHPTKDDDYATYCYTEGGGIMVGGNFGCIHGKK